MRETKHLPAGRAAGTRGTANHPWGGHWRAVVFVGRLAGIVGHGDAVVAPLHQEALRPDLIHDQPPARHEEKVDHGFLTRGASFQCGHSLTT